MQQTTKMKIKKLDKNQYEIESDKDLIYISQEKNPNTEDLYLYFIDVFELQWYWEGLKVSREPYDNEVFDELYLAIEYLENNFNIPKKIIKKIKIDPND